MTSNTKKVILVDEADREIGTCDKYRAHRLGLLHRAISVIVFDRKGQMLLQKRAADKYHSGSLWANACCSHPRPGEDTAAAARRRITEEMGIACRLRPMFEITYRSPVSNDLTEHEYVHVFSGEFDGTPKPDPAEVEDWRWAAVDALKDDVTRDSAAYAVWFRKYLAKLV